MFLYNKNSDKILSFCAIKLVMFRKKNSVDGHTEIYILLAFNFIHERVADVKCGQEKYYFKMKLYNKIACVLY